MQKIQAAVKQITLASMGPNRPSPGQGPERSRELPGRGLSYPPLATGTMLNAASSFGEKI